MQYLGTPVISSRQWTTGLAPNGSGGWNYISSSYNLHSTDPVEWTVVSDLTGAPSSQIYTSLTGIYANSNFLYSNQLRAGNGRIFFPQSHNYVCYYDPTTHTITQLPQLGSVVAHTSQILYSAAFDQGGTLYFGSQESNNNPCRIFSLNPSTLATSFIGYVGSGALGGTTYAYRLVVDTITSAKWAYVAFGQNPWQLWAINLATGTSTKLMDAPGGNVTFTQKPEGWVAHVLLVGGSTDVWCVDGAMYTYTAGYNPLTLPFTPRSITPASNPLASPPQLDIGGGIGVVGWRNGSSGPYTYVNYSVNYQTPQTIESLVATPTGIVGNAAQYQGWFTVLDSNKRITWFGAQSAMDISGGDRATIGTKCYFAGYPNGGLYEYDTIQPWVASTVPTTNPLLKGFYGPSGTGFAGIKYVSQLAYYQSVGRLYCSGLRDRTGAGAGIGYYDFNTNTFAGTYASPLDTALPTGTAVIGTKVVLAAKPLVSGTGNGRLYLFDSNLSLVSTQMPFSSQEDIGHIFPTSTPGVLCGVMVASGNIVTYLWDTVGNSLISRLNSAYSGTVTATAINPSDGSIWVATTGQDLLRVDPVTAGIYASISTASIGQVDNLAFYNNTLYMSVGAGLWTTTLGIDMVFITKTSAQALRTQYVQEEGARINSYLTDSANLGVVGTTYHYNPVLLDTDVDSIVTDLVAAGWTAVADKTKKVITVS